MNTSRLPQPSTAAPGHVPCLSVVAATKTKLISIPAVVVVRWEEDVLLVEAEDSDGAEQRGEQPRPPDQSARHHARRERRQADLSDPEISNLIQQNTRITATHTA